MVKAVKLTIDATELVASNAQEALASRIAGLIDGTAMPIINRLADIKAEYEGGPFTVLYNVMSFLGDKHPDILNSLPDPHSESGNNPAWYKLAVRNGKKETVKEVYFYDRLAELLPSVAVAMKEKDMVQRALGDPTKVNQTDITDAIKNMPTHTKQARVAKLSRVLSTARNGVGKAFELYHQLEAFDSINTVTVEIVYALDDNNQPMNGEDGRAYKVEETSTPIIITSTVTGRSTIDTKPVSINTFLKMDVEKAKAHVGGPTFQALFNTVAKGPDNPLPDTGLKVDNLKSMIVATNEVGGYLAKLIEGTSTAEWKALQLLAEKETTEGDDFFYSLAYVYNNIKTLVDNPRAQVRYQKLMDKRTEHSVKAVA